VQSASTVGDVTVFVNPAPAILDVATTPTLAPFPPPAVGLASSHDWPETLRWMLVGSGLTVTVLLIIAALTLIARRTTGQRLDGGGGMGRGMTPRQVSARAGANRATIPDRLMISLIL
jgi:hypothetical protein